ncbi:MAG: carotenoid biosynthesis protein [Candidatus Paceibacterota bacterium]
MSSLPYLNINLYLFFEFLVFVPFVIILIREYYQKNILRIYEILSCAAFGMILEVGNTILAHNYGYSSDFLVQMFGVPLAIGCGWAVIIYCAMLLSDQYNIPWFFRPFLDALTALVLDLSMDIVAIRLGFWHWVIPLNEEWFGVPYENLAGWIFVVLSFSFLIRFIRTLNPKRLLTELLMLISPILSYISLIIGLALFGLFSVIPYGINNWYQFIGFNYYPNLNVIYNPEVQQWKLIALVVIIVELINIVLFAIVKYKKKYLWRFDLLSFSILSAIHIFFLFTVFSTGIYKELPVAAVIAFIAFLAHLLLHFLPYALNPKNVYVFKEFENRLKKEQKKVEKLISKSLR